MFLCSKTPDSNEMSRFKAWRRADPLNQECLSKETNISDSDVPRKANKWLQNEFIIYSSPHGNRHVSTHQVTYVSRRRKASSESSWSLLAARRALHLGKARPRLTLVLFRSLSEALLDEERGFFVGGHAGRSPSAERFEPQSAISLLRCCAGGQALSKRRGCQQFHRHAQPARLPKQDRETQITARTEGVTSSSSSSLLGTPLLHHIFTWLIVDLFN